MPSTYLRKLSQKGYEELKEKLWETQDGRCFICEEPIDMALHQVEVDHVIPLQLGGADGPENFALAHASCNESKQDTDLRVARVLARFSKLRDACAQDNRGPNLDDVLQVHGGAQHKLQIECGQAGAIVRYSLGQVGDNTMYTERLHTDELSGFKYFFARLPIEYLYHDDRINPRPIGQNISKLVKEFHLGRPQLHISLGWVEQPSGRGVKVRVFDGQHKAAA
jgi:hypothetical protein